MPGRHMHGVGFDYGGRSATMPWPESVTHLAVCMQKRTWGCVGKLCPVIVIGHECSLSEARSEA
jgi:hypothetical protein